MNKRGATVRDVSAAEFIASYANFLKESGEFELPKWVDLVKTAHFKELAPLSDDWLYIRAASIARRIYLRPSTGVGALSRTYGGAYKRGHLKQRFTKSATGHIRYCLQQFQKMGVISRNSKGGRKVTKKGQRDLDRIAGQIVARKKKKK